MASSNQSLIYHGRIVRPDGNLVNSGTVTFTLSLYSPAPTRCLLYKEIQSVDMTGSLGLLSLKLGSGSRIDSGSHSFNSVFVNGGTLTNLACASGDSYTPSATDDRDLLVSFNDAGKIVSLSPMAIKSVPFALQAHEVDGWGVNNIVKVSSIGSPTTFTLSEMANVKTMAGLSCAPGEIPKWSGTDWGCATDAIGAAPADASYSVKGVVRFDTDATTSGITVASGVAKLSNTGVTPATYGAATKIPTFTVDAQGRLTSAAETTIALPSSQLTQSGANTGEVLKWTGTSWAPATFTNISGATAKGDVLVHNGTSLSPLPIGGDGQVLTVDSTQTSGVKWASPTVGTVTAVTAGTGLNVGAGPGGSITSSGTLNVNVGTGGNQIVQLDGSAKLPAVDGSQLTGFTASQIPNLDATKITTGVLPVNRGGTGQSTFTDGQLLIGNSVGNTLTKSTLTAGSGVSISNGNGSITISATGTGGTVTSVGVSVPAYMTSSGGPITSSGSIALGFGSQTAKTVFAAPQGTAGAPGFRTLNIADIQSSVSGNFLTGGTCTAGQSLVYSSVSDTISCQNLIPTVANNATLSNTKIWVGDSSNKAQEVAVSGDATIANTGALTIANSAVTTAKINNGAVTAAKLDSTGANGELFIGNGSGFSKSTLTAGSGVTIANSAGGITISATGTGGTVTSVTSANADIGVVNTTSTPVLTLNSGTGANQIVKLDGSAKLPAVDGSQLTGFTASQIPNLDAAKITTGTLAVNRGGTGQNSYTDGQLLIGNSVGNTLTKSTLTAGSGVTITNGNGSITIAATGTGGTVTSVGVSVPAYMTSTGGPITSSGSITLGFGSQTAKTVFAAPAGASGAPTFRNLNIADIQSSISGNFMTGGSCTAGQALAYSSVTDTIACQNLIPTVANNSTLSNTKIWLGDAGNKAQEVTISGDATIANTGALTIANSAVTTAKINNGAVTAAKLDSSGANGELFIGNGAGFSKSTLTAGSGVTITNSAGGITIAATGTGGTVTNVTASAPLSVTNGTTTPALSISQATTSTSGYLSSTDWNTFNNKLGTSLTNGSMWIGNGSNVATAVTMSGDATISNAGALTLANSGVTASTYKSVTVDAKGRVTGGTNPTTLSGFGITDAVQNTSGVPSMSAGTEAGRPAAGTAGRIYFATDTKREFRDNGTSWDQLSTNASDLASGTLPVGRLPAFTGDVTSSAGSNSITLNTVPLTKGGTGLTAAGSANQVLGMNAAGNAAEFKTMTAGSGVTITHGANSVTIAATGTGGTVTSVGVAVPAYMTSTGGPITSSGSITLGFGLQTAKTVFAAPQGANGVPTFRTLNIADIQSSVAGSFLTGGGCAAGQALVYASATDTISCQNLVPTVANNATLSNTKIWVGDASNKAQEVSLSGDATLSNAGALTLANSGVTASTYKSVTVDAKGRVTAGTNPTTLSGFGITDAIQNAGGVPSMSSGTEAARPAAGTAGRIYFATDTKREFRDNGTSWDQLSTNASDLASGTLPTGRLPALTGDVTSSAGSNSITLNTVAVNKGGTGQTSYTDGQLLIGNTSGNTLSKATLTAGSGVSITNGNGSITIAATGSGGTVTSVGVAVPAYMTSTGGPITSSGSITLGFGSQTGKTVFAAPQGSNGAPSFRTLNIADIQSSVSGNFLTGGSCTSGQSLAYNSVTDTISCQNLVPTVANNSSLSNTKIWVGDAGGKAQEVAVSGDASLASTGALTIANSAVTTAKINNGAITAAKLDSTGANGELFIGNGTGFSKATLTAGSGVNITNSAGGITIAATGSGGTVTSVSSANADISVATGTITPVLTLNSGTGNNQIVKLDGSAKLPAVDGSQLTNVNASKIQGTVVTVSSLASGNYLKYNGTAWVNAAPSSADLSDAGTLIKSTQMPASCGANQTLNFSSPTNTWSCATIAGLDAATITTGTISASRLPASASYWSAATGGINYSGGNVGIGAATPQAKLDVAGSVRVGNDAAACSSSNVGAIRYSAFYGGIQYCNGTSWTFFNPWTLDTSLRYSGTNVGIGGDANLQLEVTGTGSDPALSGSTPAGGSIRVSANGTSRVVDIGTTANYGWIQATQSNDFTYHNPIALNPNGGNVGIGTTNPQAAKLDIAGTLGLFGGTLTGDSWQRTVIYTDDANHLLVEAPTVSGTRLNMYFSNRGYGTGGARMMINGNTGNIGIGTISPRNALDVNGVISGKAAISNGTSTIDFSGGNIQYTTLNCGSFQFNNLKDGTSYTFVVQGTTSTTCSFSAYTGAGTGSLTVHLPSDHGATTASKHTIYSFFVAGSHAYFAWLPGM